MFELGAKLYYEGREKKKIKIINERRDIATNITDVQRS